MDLEAASLKGQHRRAATELPKLVIRSSTLGAVFANTPSSHLD
jgi:hypothetical protein